MVTNLFVPDRKIVVPKPPSYLKLDMAFAIGEGAKLMDKSRYRSHGTISGADWADGAHGRCLDFVAASKDYVEIPAAYDQLDFTSEDFSIIIRTKVDILTGWHYLFSRGVFAEDGYILLVTTEGALALATIQTPAYQISYSANGDITTGTWFTVGVSRVGKAVTLFKNGVDATSVKVTHINPLTCDRRAMVGIHYDGTSNAFDGKVEFLRIFGGIALSESEHLAWHNALK